MDSTISNKEIKTELYTLDNVLIIDFIKAIDNKDYTVIGNNCTETNFNNLYIDYIESIKDNSEQTGTHKIIEALEREHFIVLKLVVFLNETYNSEMVSILNDNYKYNLPEKYNGNDIKKILDKNQLILNRINLMKQKLPKDSPSKNDKGKTKSIYDIITGLSMSIGFDLDYEKLTIIKFVSYIKALRNKKDE